METITLNGIEYVPTECAPCESDHVCVICDRGWIFEGYRLADHRAGEGLTLTGAHVVRRWDNGLGIGGLAKAEHKDDYTLDAVGTITISERAVIASIPLEW